MNKNFSVAHLTTHSVDGRVPQHHGHGPLLWLRETRRQKVERVQTGHREMGSRYVWRFCRGKERQPEVRHSQAGKLQAQENHNSSMRLKKYHPMLVIRKPSKYSQVWDILLIEPKCKQALDNLLFFSQWFLSLLVILFRGLSPSEKLALISRLCIMLCKTWGSNFRDCLE